MFSDTISGCDACGGSVDPPPEFTLPPPPRPFVLDGYSISNCLELEMSLKSLKNLDIDMCKALPMLEERFLKNDALQTPVIVSVFCLLLILIVLLSSLFLWKNKRKVQNFLKCKNHIRVPHANNVLGLSIEHPSQYDGPATCLVGHRPMSNPAYNNVKFFHNNTIRYPNGYPMAAPATCLIPNSPGPDPYSSCGNLYEELMTERGFEDDLESSVTSDNEFPEDDNSRDAGESAHNTSLSSETQENKFTLPIPTDASKSQLSQHNSLDSTAAQCSHQRPIEMSNNIRIPNGKIKPCRDNAKNMYIPFSYHLQNTKVTHKDPISTIYRDTLHYRRCTEKSRNPFAQNQRNSLIQKSFTQKRNHRYRVAPPLCETSYAYGDTICNQNYYSTIQPYQVYKERRNTTIKQPQFQPLDYDQIYSQCDSSFGSDSGYSQQTPPSSVTHEDYDAIESNNLFKHNSGNLIKSFNFPWPRPTRNPNSVCNNLLNKQIRRTESQVSSESMNITDNQEHNSFPLKTRQQKSCSSDC